MALKAVIDSLDGINDNLKSEYKQGSDGKFHLDLTDLEAHHGTGALVRAKEYEKTERKTAQAKLSEIQTQLAAITEERDGMLRGSIPKADAEKLEKSWDEKLKKREKELLAERDSLATSLNSILVENVATSIAKEICVEGAEGLMVPHILGRLKAEVAEGRAITRILDSSGAPSAMSLEDFKKELLENKMFSPILSGSKAGGSSAPHGTMTQQPAGNQNVDPTKMSPQDLLAWSKSRKQH